MNVQQLTSWMNTFGQGWSRQDPVLVMSLFSKNIEYFESPFNAPYTVWEEIQKLWSVVPTNQKDVTFTYEIISCDENKGVVHWKVNRLFAATNTRQEIDGIFIVSISSNLCTYFKQWRMVKE